MLILADDLSGAADCGVACVGGGLETIVALRHVHAGPHGADVLALDADTRRLASGEAAAQVHAIILKWAQNPELLLFKKIDSTLRGNVGAELSAALNAIHAARPQSHCAAIMAPAFPANGRTTRDGTQFVHGRPLHDLDIWRIQGMTEHAHIPAILSGAGLKCALLTLDCIRSQQDILSDRMNSAAATSDVLVCDSETDDDLRRVASASMHLESKPLWVGSAGLCYQLPHAAGIAGSTATTPPVPPPISGPVLFVIGSLSRNSQEQVRQLASFSSTVAINIPPHVLLASEQDSEWHARAREFQNAMRAGHDVVLTPGAETRIDLSQRPLLAAALARMASSSSAQIGALVASGGETARAVFESIGITRLRLRGELENGIPLSIADEWGRPLPTITKAGDFGGPDALLKCLRYLHAEDARLTSPGKVVE